MKKLRPIIVSGVWITFSEFIRNEFLIKSQWTNHYSNLGLVFQTTPFNGFLWTVWGMLLAFVISKLLTKFTYLHTVYLTWITCFVMMWIVLYNLQVLPTRIVLVALPLSFVEVLIATTISKKLL